MIYVFSSASKDLYRQDVLDACCVPDGHVMRLRYSQRLVPTEFRQKPRSLRGKAALIVFASSRVKPTAQEPGDENDSLPDFDFLPVREAKVIEASSQAGILIVDVVVGKFICYGPSDSNDLSFKWDRAIKGHQNRPYPAGWPREGLFIYEAPKIAYAARDDLDAWRSLIERINRSQLANCVTYRVLGFYRIGRWSERLIRPKVRRTDCTYEFPMGGSVLLRLFFYHCADPSAQSPVLGLRVDPKAFTSASRDEFRITSRYDEARILLSCARTPDPIYSALSIVQKSGSVANARIWSAQPTFVILVKASGWFLIATLILFALGLALLNIPNTDLLALISGALSTHAANAVAAMARPIGTLLVFIASWRYLRKFPLK